MTIEKTLSIIKPDAVKKNVIGEIYNRFENAGLKIVQAQMISLTQEEAEVPTCDTSGMSPGAELNLASHEQHHLSSMGS